MEHPCVGGAKVYRNDPGHLTKIAHMPTCIIYMGENVEKLKSHDEASDSV